NIVSGDTSSPLFSEINGGLESNRVLTDYINSIIKANPDSRTYLISGAIMYDTGFTYRSTQLVYKINGVSY
ncbi:hypothetical protein JZU71_01185, partial [bacterium]|nr:hypothetical protein [bacterium]